jgi:hypothetical protein
LGRISDVNIGAGILPHNISTECNIPSLWIWAAERNREERQVSQYI